MSMKQKKSLKKKNDFKKPSGLFGFIIFAIANANLGLRFGSVVTRLRVGFVFFLGAWKSREANGWVKFMVMNPNGIPKFRRVKNIHQL